MNDQGKSTIFLLILPSGQRKHIGTGNAALENSWMRWDDPYGLHAVDRLSSKVACCRMDCSPITGWKDLFNPWTSSAVQVYSLFSLRCSPTTIAFEGKLKIDNYRLKYTKKGRDINPRP